MSKFKIETTKSKRFDIVHYNEKYTPTKEYYEQEIRDWVDLVSDYVVKGYKEVPNANGGDDDYLCVDHQNKEYIWCENGFYPFDIKSLNGFDHDNPIITLEYLYSIRN